MQPTTMSSIHTHIDAVLAERGLDRRTCFVAVFAQAPQGDRVVFECSDDAVSREVLRRLPESESRDVRGVVLPSDDVPKLLLASHSVVDVRRKPDHASELVTQVIYGDTLEVLKHDGDWFLVRMADGYIGWIRSWHLSPVEPAAAAHFDRAAKHRVVANVIQVLEEAAAAALPVSDAVTGTRLIAESGGRRGWRRVTFADGRGGYTLSKGIGLIPRRKTVSREGLVATGMRFLGIPYLWGGTTPKGFDCSGLIQRIFALHGVRLPRDADQQSRFGRLKEAESQQDLDTGDLLFFGKAGATISHVAMYVADGLFLHAFGHVRVGALDPRHNLFDARLVTDWRATRDPLDS
jgi:cell wall-associated NlpC family hydrolase